MEIDVFDPRRRKDLVLDYRNLFLASRHYNLMKGDFWPTEEDFVKGFRLLNCFEEQDYGLHIFENPHTHQLVGATPAGVAHILILDLNAPHLINERKIRAAIYQELQNEERVARLKRDNPRMLRMIEAELEIMIPLIPAPPATSKPTKRLK